MTNYTLKQGDKVSFYIQSTEKSLEGTGTIVGCATQPLPIMGSMWIVQVDPNGPVPNDEYPFNTISLPEVHLTLLR